MNEKNKKTRPKKSANDKSFDPNIVVSSTECTGLIPNPPLSEDQAESYAEIYDIPHPED
ncbi:MAG: hypothetical protein PHY77_02925 [Desulfotomaculaceae bacterium]|nr:hypothetical protein [Desulfotomaculaceae bacterium]